MSTLSVAQSVSSSPITPRSRASDLIVERPPIDELSKSTVVRQVLVHALHLCRGERANGRLSLLALHEAYVLRPRPAHDLGGVSRNDDLALVGFELMEEAQ